jgi:hypothetical protein
MGKCKEIAIKVIPQKLAHDFVRKHHYSHKVVNNTCLNFGCFLNGFLHGVLQYGPSLDKSKVLPLVSNTEWNDYLELNRMAFDDFLPRNSESYCIGKTIRMIRRQAKNIKWIISYADGCSCGDGTIYRASNFILTGIKKNTSIFLLPNGEKVQKVTLSGTSKTTPRPELGGKTIAEAFGGVFNVQKYKEITGAKLIEGFQLRYIYFIDKKYRDYLTVPEIPFTEIDTLGAGMYKGQNITRAERHSIKTKSGVVHNSDSSSKSEDQNPDINTKKTR